MGAILAHTTMSPAYAEEYLLSAGMWSSKHKAAVEAAGGTILYAHDKSGIAVAKSDNANFLTTLKGSRGVAFQSAEPDMVVSWSQPTRFMEADVEVDVTPEDEPGFPFQWNMQAIDAPAAWAAGCDGTGARVAVIDGGIYAEHPDIAPNLDVTCSRSFVDGQPFNTDVGSFWHGTHVAGIVAAADNGVGVIGVAPCATLMHVKALHKGLGSFGSIIMGILYAAHPASFGGACTKPADIINLSLGATFPKSQAGGFHSLVNKAVNYAGSKGVLVISAAGNDGLDFSKVADLIATPAQAGSGLAISATGPVGGDNYRRPASYSNYGSSLVTLAAPGGDFTMYPAAGWHLDMVLSPCSPLSAYCWSAGTSQAAPAAAGVAALIKAANPGISLGALKAKLMQTADDEGKVGNDEFYGKGFVNAYRACTE